MTADRGFLLVALAIVVMAGVAMSGHASDEARDTTTVTNETFTPNAGSWTALNDSNLEETNYGQNVTVHDENGTLMTHGTDYDWNHTVGQGTVKTIAGGDLDGDANATITYDYRQPSTAHLAIINLTGASLNALWPLLYLLVAAIVLAGLKVMT